MQSISDNRLFKLFGGPLLLQQTAQQPSGCCCLLIRRRSLDGVSAAENGQPTIDRQLQVVIWD